MRIIKHNFSKSLINTSTLLSTIAASVLLSIVTACSSDKPDNIEPVVRTLDATTITRTSATLHGNITLQGKTAMPTAMFRYGKDELSSTIVGNVSDDGKVSASIEGLSAGTTYQYQLVANGSGTTIYGNNMTFTTMPNDPPAIGGVSILSHGPTSVIIGFDIPDDGGEAITETGCYMVEGSPVTLDDKANAKKYSAYKAASDTLPWRVAITGLQKKSAYTFFPYAVSSVGETIGKALAFTTTDAIVLSEAGDFAKLIEEYDVGDSITIAGPLNGDDLSYLRRLKLKSIDMSDAHIVSGGGPYCESFYTEDNVVGQLLFAGCTTLTSISLPDNAVKLSKDVFKGCTSLKEITIPSAAKEVEVSGDCTSLETIHVSAANTSFKSVDGVLTNADITAIEWFPMGKTGSYTLPSTIKSIADYAFRDCSINEFILPDNLKQLGKGVFYGSSVEKVTLPDRLATVPTGTFQQCKKLKTVRLGSATDLISDYVFDGCPLTDLYIDASTPPVCNGAAFKTSGNDFTKTCILHVPKGRAKYYEASRYWRVFTHIEEQ